MRAECLEDFETAFVAKQITGVLPEDKLEWAPGGWDLGLAIVLPEAADELVEGLHRNLLP
jgi:hypothetical protein